MLVFGASPRLVDINKEKAASISDSLAVQIIVDIASKNIHLHPHLCTI